MYIAQRELDGTRHFWISRSFRKGRWWQHEDLVELGPDPARFILRGERQAGFTVQEELRGELRGRGVLPRPGELESLLRQFAPPQLQGSPATAPHPQRLQGSRRKLLEAEIALFDRRRLHYLVWGEFDLSAINILPVEIFVSLADKSRDEIEQDILQREQGLEPEQFNRYVFSAFNLHPYFLYLENRFLAPGQEGAGLDLLFLEEFCRINASSWFWMQEDPPDRVHPHLIRYLIMFFDYELAPGVAWEDYLRERGSGPDGPDQGLGEAEELFGIEAEKLQALSSRDLHSLYKKRALEFHPDHGGDSDKFIRLQQAYVAMMKERGQTARGG